MHTTLDLSILIPCYNEELTIEKTINTIMAYMREHYRNVTFKILVVDDGSTDNTLKILKDLQANLSALEILSYKKNKGRGYALIVGIKATSGDLVIALDADLTYDVRHIGEILQAFKENSKRDVIVVSAYMNGGVAKGVPLSRYFISRVANWILAGYFEPRIATVTCVVRGYKGPLIRSLTLLEQGKEIHLEILRKLNIVGANIHEIPGRLIWKPKETQSRRKSNVVVQKSAKKHLLYGLLVRPTRFLSTIGILVALIGLYECIVIAINVAKDYEVLPEGWAKSLWAALSSAYNNSPHTFLIAGVCLILSIQILFFIAVLTANKLQQEETLKHLLKILENQDLFLESKQSTIISRESSKNNVTSFI